MRRQSLFDGGPIQARDGDRAVVLHVDRHLGLFLNAADRLAARADQQADLFRIDLDLREPRGVRRDIGPRLADDAEHRLQQLAAGAVRLLQRFADDPFADAVDLQVELNARHAALRAGDLEVHVAEVVFVAHDVGEQREAGRPTP